MGCHGKGGDGFPKLAARFVRDVTIFDGTQMAPGTTFTKIWRLKNVGEVPWPPGARMLFVGGDQMTTEMSVPLARETPVMPGAEAIEAFFEDLPSTLAEIARKKADLAAADDAADDAADAAAAEAHLVTAKDINKDMGLGA